MPGNPDIVNAGKATQFGQAAGADPAIATRQGSPKWAIRHEMRRLAAQEVDAEGDEAFKLTGKVTRAQRIAMRALQKADQGDARSIDSAIENIDGKLTQPTFNADIAAIMAMNEDELRELNAKFNALTGAGACAAEDDPTAGAQGAAGQPDPTGTGNTD